MGEIKHTLLPLVSFLVGSETVVDSSSVSMFSVKGALFGRLGT